MSKDSTLNTDIESTRDTEKNEERRRSRSDRLANEAEEKKENISIFDERKRNLWVLRTDDFDNELSLKLEDRDLEFASVTR